MPAVRAGSKIPSRRGKASSSSRASVRARAVEAPPNLERVRITTPWDEAQEVLRTEFGMSEADIEACGTLSDEDLTEAYTMMQQCRDFENECNQVRGQRHDDPLGRGRDNDVRIGPRPFFFFPLLLTHLTPPGSPAS